MSSIPSDCIAMDEKGMKCFWLRALPPQIRESLLPIFEQPIDELVEKADQLYANTASTPPAVSAISGGRTNSPVQSSPAITTSDEIVGKIIAALNNRSNNNQQQPSQRNSKQGHRDGNNICFYHRRFGDKAFRCAPGCKFYSAPKNE